ncbi:hypothetical protein GIB67_011316 [Kingdonia uniflora]|uniref:Legume lectin domain-containing protein n=1 Tax=Kingdonia uniflora TaxID=39325 RepID=A0A7J7MNI2_9MAGN|nr:hypothetical protein GIB67_011316 [Kingdonia uniflora]
MAKLFTRKDMSTLQFTRNAAPSTGALQITPDTSSTLEHFQNKSGRVIYKTSFKLWEGNVNSTAGNIASFNTFFDINIYRHINTTSGEGLAFIIALDLDIPAQIYGQYLGLTNASTDGNWTNHLIAIRLDTVKQEFDPDDNHMGLNINNIKSNKLVPYLAISLITFDVNVDCDDFKVTLSKVDDQVFHYNVELFYGDDRLVDGKGVGIKVLDKVYETYDTMLSNSFTTKRRVCLLLVRSHKTRWISLLCWMKIHQLVGTNSNTSTIERARDQEIMGKVNKELTNEINGYTVRRCCMLTHST